MLRYNVRGAPLVHAFVRCRLTHDTPRQRKQGVVCHVGTYSFRLTPCRSLERISAQSPSEIVGGGARRVASRGAAHAPTAPSHGRLVPVRGPALAGRWSGVKYGLAWMALSVSDFL